MKKNIMPTTYNPTHILQLLQICSWKNGSSLDHHGFASLSEVISENKRPNDTIISQNYLNELLLDITKRNPEIKGVNRSASHINTITNYINCADWDTFKGVLLLFSGYIDLAKIEATVFKAQNITIVQQQAFDPVIQHQIDVIESDLSLPVKHQLISTNDPDQFFEAMQPVTSNSPFIIWCISDKWDSTFKNYVDHPALKSLLDSGQVIPVRIGSVFADANLKTSFLKQKLFLSGKVALYMSLSTINTIVSEVTTEKVKDKKSIGSKVWIEHLDNKGGTINFNDNIKVKKGTIIIGNSTTHIHKNNQNHDD